MKVFNTEIMTKKSTRLLLAVFALGLILRLGFSWHNRNSTLIFPDAGGYDTLAWNLTQGRGYVEMDGKPSTARVPGYPVFLSGIYAVFGHSVFAARLVQALLSALTILLLFYAAKSVFGTGIGLCASFLMALNPYFVFYSAHLLSETFFTMLVVLSIAVFIEALRTGKTALYAAAGIASGFASLTREVFVVFVPFAVLLVLMLESGRVSRRILMSFVVFMSFAAVLAPWVWRNYKISDSMLLRSAQATPNKSGIWVLLWQGNNEYIGSSDILTEENYVNLEVSKELERVPPGERDAFSRKKAIGLIFGSPLATVKRHLIKLWRLWGFWPREHPRINNISGMPTWAVRITSFLSDGVVIMLGIAGIVLSVGAAPRQYAFLAFIMSQTILFVVFYPMVRYRLPMMPFMMIYASYAVFLLAERYCAKRRGA
ncbi:MAG: glycosyltransferase family 39 protein [Endomicrobiales bacterium]|nr:glycosyltransferase family 39 protein [Endomicrobiales bacterium]